MAASTSASTRPRQYRRILTSTLHRKFVHASALALLVSYVVAFFIGVKTSFFWSWFPLGPCGIRALLLSIASMVVFVLRVGQMHMSTRTTSSSFATFKRQVFSITTVQTFFWYMFSAWWFSEVYMWTSSQSADLGWVKPGKPHERAKLNERPIYLHCYYALLAITQAVLHLWFDWDRVPIPVTKRTKDCADQRTHVLESVPARIRNALPRLLYMAVLRSCLVAVAGPFVYMFFLRKTAWGFTLYFAKLVWNFPRSASDPPGMIPPLHISLLLRSATSGTLLVALWQASNLFFSVFLGQGPLKKTKPLTTETKDPNGSLINGLQAKKDMVKTYAFWELCLISQQFPDRRKQIFSDIDRTGGAAWTQIFNASTDVIKGISTRINEFKKPKTPPPSTAPPEAPAAAPSVESLPRLTSAPQDTNIFLSSPKPNTRPEKFESAFGSVAKSYGQSPDWTPAARDKARNMFDRAATAVLTPERRRRLSASARELKRLTNSSMTTTAPSGQSGTTNLHPLLQTLLRSYIGRVFQQPYARRLRMVVLGSPQGTISPIVDATESLTRLLVASLTEDTFGKVQNDVASVVRLFTETITALESFTSGSGLPVHWTDVDFSRRAASKDARKVEDVEIVLSALKGGLAELLDEFRLYLGQIGLVGKDLRLAREAAGLVA
ncbi:hypothetical protein AJ80_03018 [Polytolypa hystricis UAMH7299]|uniref:Nucleoporin NDC1 n=1 Tax=Polytolypa hystricis (strain UAMH7299) TaxID=1447883 RepID=A0A2B7YPJ6_POLH7|nr:hypothetical protein AJ80_03018 [Polytolypa hystricis UAMH7299]